MLEILIKGIIIGISVAAPVGPIGLLCINKTLKEGKINGLAVGFGAASADVVYGLIAALGLTIISDFLLSYENILKIFGSLFLLYLAFNIYYSEIKNNSKIKIKETNILKEYFSSFLLTITNPITILSFLAIFTSLNGLSSSFIIVIGIFLGSILWWLFLVGITSILHKKINDKIIGNINKISALILLCFAGFSIISIF